MVAKDMRDEEPPTRRLPSPLAELDAPSTRRYPPHNDVEPPRSSRWFSVRLAYIEPGYAASMASRPKTYSARFAVLAPSADDAVAAAKARFAQMQRTSGVGWERVITGT